MPGLLQAPEGSWHGPKFLMALAAEFLGVFLFAVFGSVVPAGTIAQAGGGEATGGGGAAANNAAWGNGLTLAVLVYITANISGGHLNPAVTLATMVSKHTSVQRGLLYMLAQSTGAIFGMLLVAGLEPTAYIGMGNGGLGCFAAGASVGKAQLFGWEFFMTFVLVSTVFAVAVGKPNFGIMGPWVVGVALWAMALCGGQYTGAALNPARVLGPSAVFHCNWDLVWIYWLAEFAAGIVAGAVAYPLYGEFVNTDTKLMTGGNNNSKGRSKRSSSSDDVEQGQSDTANGQDQ